MSETKAPVKLRRVRPVQHLLDATGLALGGVREILGALLEPQDIDGKSELTPGEMTVVLAFDTLTKMGYQRDRAFAIVRPYAADIEEYLNSSESLQDLGMLIIHDNRYVLWGLHTDRYFDLTESKVHFGADLPLPAVVFCLSTLGLYLRTFAKTLDRLASTGAGISAVPSTEASADCQPPPP